MIHGLVVKSFTRKILSLKEKPAVKNEKELGDESKGDKKAESLYETEVIHESS